VPPGVRCDGQIAFTKSTECARVFPLDKVWHDYGVSRVHDDPHQASYTGDAVVSGLPADREMASEVFRRLQEAYGTPDWRPRYDPMEELVLTFLSQNTSDVNSGRAFEALRARYPTWQAVMDAPVDELAQNDPFRRPVAAKGASHSERAAPDSGRNTGSSVWIFLPRCQPKKGLRWLRSFGGIGHKDGFPSCCFSASNKPVFPVDTPRRAGHAQTGPGRTEAERGEDRWDLAVTGAPGVVLSAAPQPDPPRAAKSAWPARLVVPVCVLNSVCRYEYKT